MMFVRILLAVLMSLPVYAWAGKGEVGNGGHVVKCNAGKDANMVSLDLYLSHVEVDGSFLGGPKTPHEEKLVKMIDRIAYFDRAMALALSEILKKIIKEKVFVTDLELADLDWNPEVPSSCDIVQGALQFNDVLKSNKAHLKTVYLFSKKVWEQLDENSRAVLMLHEAFYTYMIHFHFHRNPKHLMGYIGGLLRSMVSSDVNFEDSHSYSEFKQKIIDF